MMWKEFEEIAGYEVTFEDYSKIIEPMYMAIPEGISKKEFVAMLDKKRFAIPTAGEYLAKVRREAKILRHICGHRCDYEAERRAEEAAKAYAKRKWGIDWSHDSESYVYFLREYEYEGMRGCSYPSVLVVGRKGGEYERGNLLK